MKNIPLAAVVAIAVGLGSCQTKCPAYTQKAPNRQASDVTASVAQPTAERL